MSIVRKILKKILSRLMPFIYKLERPIVQERMLLGKLLINQHKSIEFSSMQQAEFRIFSQWGEDGIIQYLISKVPIRNSVFVEFGVENYRESNTRFLLMNNNWKGLVIDSDSAYIRQVRRSDAYSRHDLTAINAFITKNNINQLITSNGISGDIGLLSIDIDGNDYWVWQAINKISPRIVVCEFNSVFGSKEAVTIPYNENFDRTEAHYSNLYFGASLKALCLLAKQKGYVFVGSNTAGVNAFFVREDFSSKVQILDYQTGYVKSRFRESRDENGELTYVSGNDRIKLIQNLEVVDVQSGKVIPLREVDT